MSLSIVILAAGQGVRMRSELPKVLHPIGGVPILSRIVSTVSQLHPYQIVVVYGEKVEQLKNALTQYPEIVWALQEKRLGTGHAALSALPYLTGDRVLILYGDIPLIKVDTLVRLLQVPVHSMGLIAATVSDPAGLGRIIRDEQGNILRIVEEKDATLEEKKITEINTGFFVASKVHLQNCLTKLTANNAQQEYYLSDIVEVATKEGIPVTTVAPVAEWEIIGVNDKVQLSNLERIFQREQALQFMQQGVTLLDPMRFDLRGELDVGNDVVMDVNVTLEGQLRLGNHVTLGPNVWIKDTIIEDNVHILANTVIENAIIKRGCQIGPFARVRPGTVLENQVKIGNFVEIKETTVGAKSKINHLSYVGDASIGEGVNVGAGTITCNFDGHKKHKTIIGDEVFIGSDTQLIAPLTIGEGVMIGAGTTVTRDIPAYSLVHNRIEQRNIANWKNAKEAEE